jgi:hypothetical protein
MDVIRAIGGFDEDFNPGAYDDDAISFRIRRLGYKLMLATDTYVHHFGSVTFNAEYVKSNIAERNRDLFFKKFAVDSWAAAMIDFNVVNLVRYQQKDQINLLGVGRSCGSTLLQVKNRFKGIGIPDVAIDYMSEYSGNLPDLATVCRKCVCAPLQDIRLVFGNCGYDLIVVESETDKLEDAGGVYKELAGLIEPDGQLITTATAATFPAISNILMNHGFTGIRQMNNYYYSFTKP